MDPVDRDKSPEELAKTCHQLRLENSMLKGQEAGWAEDSRRMNNAINALIMWENGEPMLRGSIPRDLPESVERAFLLAYHGLDR